MKYLSKQYTDRIEGLVNEKALDDFKQSVKIITIDMIEEGFEVDDINDYMTNYIESILNQVENEKT
jgi:hypothetical protein